MRVLPFLLPLLSSAGAVRVSAPPAPAGFGAGHEVMHFGGGAADGDLSVSILGEEAANELAAAQALWEYGIYRDPAMYIGMYVPPVCWAVDPGLASGAIPGGDSSSSSAASVPPPADQPLEDPDGWNPDEELAWQEQLEEDTCTTES